MSLPLRLAMDERMLLDARTGVGTYAQNLCAAITQISDRSTLICDRADRSSPAPAPFRRPGRWARALWPFARSLHRAASSNPERYIFPDVFRLAQVFFDIWGRPLDLRVPGPSGIVHWSYPLPVRLIGWKNLYTVHDAIPLTTPTLSAINPGRHRNLLRAIADEAAAFVTVSNSAQAEIVAALSIPELPIINCSTAVAVTAGPGRLLPFGLNARGYWLVVGSVEKRKNIPTIIEAHRSADTGLPLVIVGPDGSGSEAITPLLADPGVIRIPYLPADQLQQLMMQAKALLMLSLAEGFGLPIAEAMALGTPVITSNTGAQAETAGGAALLVDPKRSDEMSAAIQRLAGDEILYQTLVRRGFARALDFTPDRFAERLAELYADIAR